MGIFPGMQRWFKIWKSINIIHVTKELNIQSFQQTQNVFDELQSQSLGTERNLLNMTKRISEINYSGHT